ncbi:MAG: ATP-binding protein [Terriglobales bacterium]
MSRLPGRPRSRRVIAMAAALVIVIIILFWPQAFSLHFQPSPANTALLFLLSTLSFLATVILALVLGRQIVKLQAERRANVLGSRFKTKLVIGALALSLTPVICMFGFTYGLINRTLDKWFSQPVVTVRNDNQRALGLLTQFVSENARSEAQFIAASPALAKALQTQDQTAMSKALARHRVTLQGGFAALLGARGQVRASFQLPRGYQPPAQAPEAGGWQQTIGGRGFMITRTAFPAGGAVEVGMPIPATITAQIARLAQDRDRYDRLARERKSLRLIYTGYLALLTLAVLFGATWMALVLSKQVTVPMGQLAAATQEISRGNLAYRVQNRAPPGKDEIGLLVASFNRMAQELETNRAQIEASRQELEARRLYTETLLENTPSAVLSLDASYHIERVNPAVGRLFGRSTAPERLEDLFTSTSLREVQHLLRKAERWHSASSQLDVTHAGRTIVLAATAAALAAGSGGRRPAGYVLVLEELTELLRAQKTAAWREVAQRIAHEIKNPLTPITLCAQRIQRRLGDAAVAAECARTIESEAHSLQRLVDEFSAFARFPHAQPVDCDLNEIIERALRSFDGRLDGIEIRTLLEERLPRLRLDPEDMKRVFLNLIDNAAEAMRGSPYRQLTLATQLEQDSVEAVVADTGPGLPPGDKQRLFLPYYSTKQRGSGLGLAIVQRIVEESGGTLRAEENEPLGARFVIELPLAAAIGQDAASSV